MQKRASNPITGRRGERNETKPKKGFWGGKRNYVPSLKMRKGLVKCHTTKERVSSVRIQPCGGGKRGGELRHRRVRCKSREKSDEKDPGMQGY